MYNFWVSKLFLNVVSDLSCQSVVWRQCAGVPKHCVALWGVHVTVVRVSSFLQQRGSILFSACQGWSLCTLVSRCYVDVEWVSVILGFVLYMGICVRVRVFLTDKRRVFFLSLLKIYVIITLLCAIIYFLFSSNITCYRSFPLQPMFPLSCAVTEILPRKLNCGRSAWIFQFSL
jgi:hypothetical protein